MAANLEITRTIQTGSSNQPALQPFASQQQQALRDAFITGANASELSDGFGSELGAAYRRRADYKTPRDYTSVSPGMADLIAYTNAMTASDSNLGQILLRERHDERDGTRLGHRDRPPATHRRCG